MGDVVAEHDGHLYALRAAAVKEAWDTGWVSSEQLPAACDLIWGCSVRPACGMRRKLPVVEGPLELAVALRKVAQGVAGLAVSSLFVTASVATLDVRLREVRRGVSQQGLAGAIPHRRWGCPAGGCPGGAGAAAPAAPGT